MNLPATPLRRPIPAAPSRETLLYFIKSHAPDLRIKKARLDDGRRACGARFTFAGETIEVEAIESDTVADPDDAVVRRAAWMIYRRLGIRMHIDGVRRAMLEQQILDASQRGDADTAARLGLELVMANEGTVVAGGVRNRFER